MRRIALDIELLEDCVFSARSATDEGGHESLDRVPGGALLGAAAARLYRTLGNDAFTAFHSGRLRFGDGLPLSDDGEIGYPVPRCWHHPRTVPPAANGRLHAEVITSFLRADPLAGEGEDAQPRQLREGYVTPGGRWLRPRRDLRLKTAIEATTGRAAEGQLFGYDALHRGQRFRAFLEADDELDASLFEQVAEALTGEVLLGRSRSAEYGRARVAPAEAAPPQPGPSPGTEIILWLLSDLALLDGHGQPTLQPEPRHFGLEGGRVVWDRTFLRARRYSPWNAARGGFDRERLVLEAGGVIALEAPEGCDRAVLGERIARGVGLHREAGLGRVWLDPPLLGEVHPRFEASAAADAARPGPSPAPRPSHPLAAWLERQDIAWKQCSEEAARRFVEEYRQLLDAARRVEGIARDADYGPSRSQWGTVMQTARARETDDARALHEALFQGSSAVIKEGGEGWGIEVRDGDRYRKLAVWLRERLEPGAHGTPKGGRDYAHFLRSAARRIQDTIRQRRA